MGGYQALCLDGSGNRIHRRREDDEEGVALRVDLAAARQLEGVAQQLSVLGDCLPVAIAQLTFEPGRALHVCEEEGDRSGGQLAHRPLGARRLRH
jgi:hypothetical protein